MSFLQLLESHLYFVYSLCGVLVCLAHTSEYLLSTFFLLLNKTMT